MHTGKRFMFVISINDDGSKHEEGYISACNIFDLGGAWYTHIYYEGDRFFDSMEQAIEHVDREIGEPYCFL